MIIIDKANTVPFKSELMVHCESQFLTRFLHDHENACKAFVCGVQYNIKKKKINSNQLTDFA